MDPPNTSSPFVGNSSTEENESQKDLELGKKQVDEVVDLMQQNVQKLVRRGENESQIDHRTEEALRLRKTEMQFQWWVNLKMKLCVVGIILTIIRLALLLFPTTDN